VTNQAPSTIAATLAAASACWPGAHARNVERERHRRVSETFADHLDVHAGGEEVAGVRVPQVVKRTRGTSDARTSRSNALVMTSGFHGRTVTLDKKVSPEILGWPAYIASDMSTSLNTVTNSAFVCGAFE
jgi:hypothetical protein